MANAEIRAAMQAAGVRMWRVADKLGIADSTMTKWLRHELPEAKQKAVLDAIRQAAEETEV